MHLVQLLLPVRNNNGEEFDQRLFEDVAAALTERFGGVTAYNRAPAQGRWESRGKVEHDEIVVMEVMADSLDRGWWQNFRSELERRFSQDRLIVRAETIELL